MEILKGSPKQYFSGVAIHFSISKLGGNMASRVSKPEFKDLKERNRMSAMDN